MVGISIHCTLLLAALLLSSALCIKSAPAACPPQPLISSCPVLPSAYFDTTLPLSNQSCLFLLTNLSSSSPFTIAFSDQLLLGFSPGLGFALFRPQLNPFVEIILNLSVPDSCADVAGSLLATCEAGTQIFTSSSCKPSADHSESDLFNYSVSLTHNASSSSLLVQAEVNYGGGFELKQTFILNSTDLDDDYRGQDDSIGLFVNYVSGGKTAINITPMNDAPSPSLSSMDSLPPHQNHSKSSHTTVVLWVVVGVSMVASVVAVTIIALAINKLYRGRPPLVRSHLAGGHVAPPSTTTRAPFPHPHLESSATMATLRLSPPYHADNFQTSGTASWLKQPNPR